MVPQIMSFNQIGKSSIFVSSKARNAFEIHLALPTLRWHHPLEVWWMPVNRGWMADSSNEENDAHLVDWPLINGKIYFAIPLAALQ